MVNDRQVVIRVPADAVKRAERLVGRLVTQPEYVGIRITWTTVLRLALLRGLANLEGASESKAKKGAR